VQSVDEPVLAKRIDRLAVHLVGHTCIVSQARDRVHDI
jgi:hypothetical protein